MMSCGVGTSIALMTQKPSIRLLQPTSRKVCIRPQQKYLLERTFGQVRVSLQTSLGIYTLEIRKRKVTIARPQPLCSLNYSIVEGIEKLVAKIQQGQERYQNVQQPASVRAGKRKRDKESQQEYIEKDNELVRTDNYRPGLGRLELKYLGRNCQT